MNVLQQVGSGLQLTLTLNLFGVRELNVNAFI